MAILTGVYLSSAFAFDAASSNPVDIISVSYEGSNVNIVYQDAAGNVRLTRASDVSFADMAYSIITSAAT